MIDFFISYAAADSAWAEWLGFVLEEEGFTTILQAWDFRPGSNFVLEMQRAASAADRTIMVLSPDYLKSQFASPEWAAALAQDPQGLDRKLVPVMVRRCSPPGLLASIIHIDLAEKDEAAARDCLVRGVSDKRAKPSRRPQFPGAPEPKPPHSYPGRHSGTAGIPPRTYMPKVNRPTSEFERRRFMHGAFDLIKEHFRTGLDELAMQADDVESDFQPTTATDFTAELFVGGKSTCRCRIWQGGMLSSDGISYAEGNSHHGGNSCNEMLSIADGDGELRLSSLMGTGFGRPHGQLDLKRMTADQAADYLWRRFVAPLER